MALAILFNQASMNATQYDACIKRLEAAGAGSPKGRLYHVCFGTDDQRRVLDIWDSMESFEKFGQVLVPILQQLGANPGQPEIFPLHNTIKG